MALNLLERPLTKYVHSYLSGSLPSYNFSKYSNVPLHPTKFPLIASICNTFPQFALCLPPAFLTFSSHLCTFQMYIYFLISCQLSSFLNFMFLLLHRVWLNLMGISTKIYWSRKEIKQMPLLIIKYAHVMNLYLDVRSLFTLVV